MASEPAPRDGILRTDVERAYRAYAPVYDAVFGLSLAPGRAALMRAVAALAPARILEVGVGTGLTLGRYPAASFVTGIDVSEEMLRVAAARVNGAHSGRIALRRMDAEAMDFADASFDCVTLPYVLSVTPDPDRLIAEVRRVCRRGGDILIVNHFSGGRFWRPVEHVLRPLAAKIGFRSEFSFERYIAAQDWTVLSSKSTNLFALSRLIHIRND
jgi:phosphatidylethanolamine/phosphatidyl-N-methylethanolamine N-methyltransferase